MNLKERAKRLAADIPAILVALKNKSTPLGARLMAAVTVCYALSPIDLIPDFIPVIGYLDDLIILPALVALTIRLIPKVVLEDCRRNAEKQINYHKRWYCSVPVILIWILIFAAAFRAGLRCLHA